jgi:hypothetical protein
VFLIYLSTHPHINENPNIISASLHISRLSPSYITTEFVSIHLQSFAFIIDDFLIQPDNDDDDNDDDDDDDDDNDEDNELLSPLKKHGPSLIILSDILFVFIYSLHLSCIKESHLNFLPFLDVSDEDNDCDTHIPFFKLLSLIHIHPTFEHDSKEERVMQSSQLYHPYTPALYEEEKSSSLFLSS